MREAETRGWLWNRSLEQWCDSDLREQDIDWIMKEEHYETTFLKWEGDTTKETPASGGKWFIRAGNMLNLAELLAWGKRHELYKM